MLFKRLIPLIAILFSSSLMFISAQDQKLDSLLEDAYDQRRNNLQYSDSLVNWIIQFSSEIGDSKMLLKALRDAALIQSSNGFYGKAEDYYQRAAKAADSLNDIYWKSKINIDRSRNLLNQNKQAECLEKGLLALEQARDYGDTTHLIKLLSAFADITNTTQSADLAFKYSNEAIRLTWLIRDSSLLIRSYNNLSVVLAENENNYEAIDTLKRALSFIGKNDLFGKGKLLSNIGFSYRNLGEYDSALVYNHRSLAVKRKVNDVPGIAYSFDAIGRCFIGLGELDSAVFYIKQALDSAIKYKDVYRIKDINVHLSEAYAEKGNYELAYKHYRTGKTMDDSLYSVEVAEKVRSLEQRFNISQKERIIEQLDAEKKIETKKNQLLIILVAAVSVLALLLITLLYYRNRSRAKERQLYQEQLKTAKLENENNQKALSHFLEDLQLKNRQLKSLSEIINQKDQELNRLNQAQAGDKEQLVELRILTEEDWARFKTLFTKVHPHFFDRLKEHEVDYTKGELRLMSLLKLELSNSEVADSLGISAESVSKSKFRLKTKLLLGKEDSLEHFVQTI